MSTAAHTPEQRAAEFAPVQPTHDWRAYCAAAGQWLIAAGHASQETVFSMDLEDLRRAVNDAQFEGGFLAFCDEMDALSCTGSLPSPEIKAQRLVAKFSPFHIIASAHALAGLNPEAVKPALEAFEKLASVSRCSCSPAPKSRVCPTCAAHQAIGALRQPVTQA